MPSKNTKGFTLIELLVVISIIGLLSSIVVASVNVARNRAKDAVIKSDVAQFAILLNLEYNDNTTTGFANLQGACWVVASTCNVAFAGSYATKARELCNDMYKNATDGETGTGPGNRACFLTDPTFPSSNNYSVMVHLNNGKWYCSGSSGIKGEYDWVDKKGCYADP